MTASGIFNPLTDHIPRDITPKTASEARIFIDKLCNLTSITAYNAVLVLLQDPEATIALSKWNWREVGMVPNKDARPLVIIDQYGPARIVYDVRNVHATSPKHRTPTAEEVKRGRYHASPGEARSDLRRFFRPAGIRPNLMARCRKCTEAELSQQAISTYPVSEHCIGDPESRGERAYYLYECVHTTKDEPYIPRNQEVVSRELEIMLFSLAHLSINYEVPWISRPSDPTLNGLFEDERRERMTLRPRTPQYDDDDITPYFQAALASYIVSRRFGLNLKFPLADEFMAEGKIPSSSRIAMQRILMAAHFMESALASDFKRAKRRHPFRGKN